MKSIRVLDVTLRDGGCVNNFNFGTEYMHRILDAQEQSGVDVIEVGYIDFEKGSLSERTQYASVQAIESALLHHKKEGVKYVAMIDYGKYPLEQLPPRSKSSIDGIRLAFHKKHLPFLVEAGNVILEKGYELYIQPMITLRYSDAELLELINLVNTHLNAASGFYIVDSFGEMRPNDMSRALTVVDNNLIPSMLMGFHSHNNLQMSYSNAATMLQFPTSRDIMIDASIMGMGKGAGNLNTELLLEHLNLYYGKKYKIAPLLEVMDKVINQLHSEFYWGYAPEYYLSSANHCTPSYASHFYNKHMLPIDQVGELLSMIDEEKKISFDRNYAEQLYRQYNESKQVDDTLVVNDLVHILRGKQVLLLAPGMSLKEHHAVVEQKLKSDNVITIGLNTTADYDVDYLLITRQEVFEHFVGAPIPIITTSAVTKGVRGDVKILNYKTWIEVDDQTHDSSFVIAMNLLKHCGVSVVWLAGLDGFSPNINDNYYDANMRRPVTEELARLRNKYYQRFIRTMRSTGMVVNFITPSKYES
jgi:4-hydroxy 2-oxovalerate aldolase